MMAIHTEGADMSDTLLDALKQARAAMMDAYFGIGDWAPKLNEAIARVELAIAVNPASLPTGEVVTVPKEPTTAILDYLRKETGFGPGYLREKFWPAFVATASTKGGTLPEGSGE